MTTLAPLPGRETGPAGTGAAGSNDDVATFADKDPTVIVSEPPAARPGSAAAETIDLTGPRSRRPARDPAAQASWVFGLALSLLSEGVSERVALPEILAEAAGRSRALEGAYGRAVALLSEYPGDPLVQRTVDVLAKALLRSRRPARAPEEA